MASKPAVLQRAATAPVLASAEAFRGRTPGTSPVRRASTAFGGGKRAAHDREHSRSGPAALLARVTPSPVVLATLALLSICVCAAVPTLFGGFLAAEEASGLGADGPVLGLGRPAVLRQQNRRMALETALNTQNSALKVDTAAAAALEIEFRDAGNRVPLAAALDPSRWNEPAIFDNESTITDPQVLDALLAPLRQSAGAGAAPLPAHCPQGPVRVFIGTMTRCCVASARAKRDAIRATWLKEVKEQYPGSITTAWIVNQPGDAAAVPAAADFLAEEVREHGDIVVLPGTEDYFKLVDKTLSMLRYALSSPCRYTHILKTDDDVFLRPQRLMEIIEKGEFHYQFQIQAPPTAALFFDGRRRVNDTTSSANNTSDDSDLLKIGADNAQDRPLFLQPTRTAPAPQKPWLTGMYLGKVDSNVSGTFPGWHPLRLRTSKWYLPAATLPDADAPLGVRWASGWGYLMSRDVAEAAWGAAVTQASQEKKERYAWWGRLPWEDVVVSALLAGAEIEGEKVMLSHHDGFKAAWDGCDSGTVLKHLDNDAPTLTAGLAAQEVSGLWAAKEIVCSSGPFVPGQYGAWRKWRNNLPDSLANGFM